MKLGSLDTLRKFDPENAHEKLCRYGLDTTQWRPSQKSISRYRLMPQERLPHSLSPYAYESLARARAHKAADRALLKAVEANTYDRNNINGCKKVWNTAFIEAEKKRYERESKADTSRGD